MFNAPKTKAEAEAYKYHQWAGNPQGWEYDNTCCAYEIWQKHLPYQCERKPGHGPDGLYCKQHAKRFN